LRVTFVIPWFGEQLGGGAEALCREFAARLARAGADVEVLATCSRDHDADWHTDHHRPGRAVAAEGYAVERFPVRRGDSRLFADLNRRVLAGEALGYREERAFLDNSIRSDQLTRAVEARAGHRALVVLPYLFGLTHDALEAAGGRAILWPCLHDEGYAHLRLVAGGFRRAAGVVFNSPAEEALARSLHLSIRDSAVVGMGIDLPPDDPSAAPGDPPHLLYLGRRSAEKGFDWLLRSFDLLARQHDRVELHVAGKGPAVTGAHPRVRDLGFLADAGKAPTLRGALALVMPSRRESFSIALLEALACRTPVLVHSGCGPTRGHVEAGRCGLHFRDGAELAECALALLSQPKLRHRLGANGRAYVAQGFAWDEKVARLVAFLRKAARHAD
jgi:glycosyltransferase involved in cell wall biosynthesis